MGIDVSHESVRFRWQRFGPKFACVHACVFNQFNQERSLYSRTNFKRNRAALAEWRQLGTAPWSDTLTLSKPVGICLAGALEGITDLSNIVQHDQQNQRLAKGRG